MTQRQTGRTTRILVDAAFAKQRGERVLIVAPNAMVQDHMIMMARKEGLLLRQGVVTTAGVLDRRKDFATVTDVVSGRYRGFRGDIYEDHTVREWLKGKTKVQTKVEYCREVALFRMEKVTVPAPRWKFQPF